MRQEHRAKIAKNPPRLSAVSQDDDRRTNPVQSEGGLGSDNFRNINNCINNS